VELTFAEAAGKGVYENFYALRKRAPSGYTAPTYSTVRVLLDTAREVKSLETDKVTRALEGRKFTYLKGPEQIRACDHANIQDVYLCKGKSAAGMKDGWDYFDIVQAVGGEATAESCEGEGLLLARYHAPIELSILAGALGGTLTALVLGVFVLRKRGVYLAMLTLALSQVFYYVVLMWTPVTGGTDGLGNLPVLYLSEPLGWRLSKRPVTRYYVIAAIIFAAMLAIRHLLRSPLGRVMRAVKANARAGERARPGDPRTPRAPRQAARPRRRAVPRRAALSRDRHRARYRPRFLAARRADRGHEPRRDAADGGVRPEARRPCHDRGG
jgi:hypothetical protein